MTDQNAIVPEPQIHLGIIPARTPHDVIVQASIIAKELRSIVKENKLSLNIQGREFVRVEGWSTMGAMLGVLPREVPELTKRFDDGSYEASVELVRISDGAVIGRASALVGMDEKDRYGKLTWGSRPEYARRSMAVTRATGKAYRLGFSWIMGMAGFEPTPAEEMEPVVDGEFTEKPAPAASAKPKTQSKSELEILSDMGFDDRQPVKPNGHKAERPLSPEQLSDMIEKKAKTYSGRTASKQQVGLLAGMLDILCAGDDDKRHTMQEYLLGVASLNDADGAVILAALDWVKPVKDSGGAYQPDPMAVTEANAVWTAALKSEGQAELI